MHNGILFFITNMNLFDEYMPVFKEMLKLGASRSIKNLKGETVFDLVKAKEDLILNKLEIK